MIFSPMRVEGNFLTSRFLQFPFQAVQKLLDIINANRPFFASLFDTFVDLAAAEGLPAAVFFFYHQGSNFFHLFIGGKAALTIQALPAAADGVGLPAKPGVGDASFNAAAVGTAHGSLPEQYPQVRERWLELPVTYG